MKNKLKFLPIIILTLITVFSAVGLSSARVIAATSDAPVSVTVTPACTLVNESTEYTTAISVVPGMSGTTEGVTRPTFQFSCNNPAGFKLTAIGFSPNADSEGAGVVGNTTMYSPSGTISTGTSGPDSYWAMKASSIVSSPSTGVTVDANIDYDGVYGVIPASTADIAEFKAGTTDTILGSVKIDYKVYVSPGQPADTYTGKVKYTFVEN